MKKLPYARKQQIIEMLKTNDFVDADELSKQLNVSYMTINRDLNELQKQGIAKRVHGGAQSIENHQKSLVTGAIKYSKIDEKKKVIPYFDLTIEERFNIMTEEKQRIAEMAAKFVNDGDVIGMDSSTTILHMCNFLLNKKITVVTTSLMVALQFASSKTVTVILPAGRLRKRSYSIIDSGLDETLKKIHMDKCFLSSHALSGEDGLMDLTMEESDSKRKLIERSNELYVLVDHTKIDKTASFKICNFDEMDSLIIDKKSIKGKEKSTCIKKCIKNKVKIIYAD